MIRPARLLAGLAIFGFFVWAAGRAADAEFASAGGVLEERGEGKTAGQVDTRLVAATPRSSSACGASSIGPDGRVTVTSCGERLSERVDERVSARASPQYSPRSESLYQGKRAPMSQDLVTSRAVSIAAIRKVFGRRAAPAIRVANCETGGTFDARAVGRAGERGLFQIHPIHFSWAQPRRLFDPVWNSRVAYRLSRGGTRWGPWSCRWAA